MSAQPPRHYSYWDGASRPALIDLCLASQRLHAERAGREFVLLNFETALGMLPGKEADYLRGLLLRFDHGSAVHSDVLRVMILGRYGGSWSNADVLHFQDHELPGPGKELVGYMDLESDDAVGRITNCYIAAAPGSALLRERENDQVLRLKNAVRKARYADYDRPIKWAVDARHCKAIEARDWRLVLPVRGGHVANVLVHGVPKQMVREARERIDEARAIHLWSKTVRAVGDRDPAKGDSLLARAINRALYGPKIGPLVHG